MMKKETNNSLSFATIADLMQALGLPAPLHPLIHLVNYDQESPDLTQAGRRLLLQFYKISFKNTFNGQVKYGPGTYDFKEGGLAFVGPHQLVEMLADPTDYQGYALYFHPDLLYQYPLAQTIHRYGFFSYAVSEALFLSTREKGVIASLFGSIAWELENNIDSFSQDVLVSQIELLLNYSNRFYNRQFLTRKILHHELIDRMNRYLNNQLANEKGLPEGLPSPVEIAGHLKVSQRYLSDMLRSLTGKTTQQHIHLWLVDKAKELLSQNTMTTSEIAYFLGFEHPQSFHKLFKQKTSFSPSAFRQSMHDPT